MDVKITMYVEKNILLLFTCNSCLKNFVWYNYFISLHVVDKITTFNRTVYKMNKNKFYKCETRQIYCTKELFIRIM